MTMTLVAAVARNGVIGAGNTMPWHLPEDFRHFKALTLGYPLVMGRKTFVSIGRPLPGRRSIVVTRDRSWSWPGVETVHSVQEALDLVDGGPVMIGGGGEIYAQTIGSADRLEITHVDIDSTGDTVFPLIDPQTWELVETLPREGFSWATYVRSVRPTQLGQ